MWINLLTHKQFEKFLKENLARNWLIFFLGKDCGGAVN